MLRDRNDASRRNKFMEVGSVRAARMGDLKSKRLVAIRNRMNRRFSTFSAASAAWKSKKDLTESDNKRASENPPSMQ